MFRELVRRLNFPTTLEFNQWKLVRSVSIYLVRRGENESSFRAELPRCLEHDQCPHSVDCKVGKGFARSPIVTRLRCGVHDERNVFAEFSEYLIDAVLITNVEWIMFVILKGLLQVLSVPTGRSLFAEKITTHVIINANYFHSFFMK